MHEALAEALDDVDERLASIHAEARAPGTTPADARKPRWPLLVLRTPKGWTGPHEVDGTLVEGTFRSHQVPFSGVREDDAHRELLEGWMRSYRPDELFDDEGRPTPATLASLPRRELRIAASDRANGGRRIVELELPAWDQLAVDVPEPGRSRAESTRLAGQLFRDAYRQNPDSFRLFCPDETNSNRLGAVFEATDRCLMERIEPEDEHQAPDGRVMEVLSEHLCQGWLEGYTLTGRHGVFASYEAFAMVSASMTVQHAKWLQEAAHLPWRADVPSLNILLTSTCWRNDHNGFSHQGPGLIDTVLSKEAGVARIYLPPDGNSLLSVTDHCLRSRSYVNLIVIDKQSQLQWMTAEQARVHCSRGLGVWDWASTPGDGRDEPDVVLACIGDVPTLETVAAADILRRHVPDLAVRVVNVVDLMSLFTPDEHPHGIDGLTFANVFTEDTHVVVAFHGYARAIHQLLHGRPEPTRFHVKGFREQGTTTTPFDMVVRNGMSRYHLVLEAMDRSARELPGFDELAAHCEEQLDRHDRWVTKHFQDLPEIREWSWPHGR